MEKIPCCQCGRYFIPDPRQKNQRYCREKACQRARKAAWQREKMVIDPGYRANQKQSQSDWQSRNADYWKRYRAAHPEAGGSQPGFAEGSEQTSSFARCCQDGRVGDCKDGRVKIGQIISRIMASGFFLVGSGDCKDGRDKSNFTPDSRHITMIAKKDVIDGRFFC